MGAYVTFEASRPQLNLKLKVVDQLRRPLQHADVPDVTKGSATRVHPVTIFEMPLWWCPHVPNTREALLKELRGREPGLVIDGGAYDGKDAVDFALQGHRVISIEPTPGRKQGVINRTIHTSK